MLKYVYFQSAFNRDNHNYSSRKRRLFHEPPSLLRSKFLSLAVNLRVSSLKQTHSYASTVNARGGSEPMNQIRVLLLGELPPPFFGNSPFTRVRARLAFENISIALPVCIRKRKLRVRRVISKLLYFLPFKYSCRAFPVPVSVGLSNEELRSQRAFVINRRHFIILRRNRKRGFRFI